MRIPFQINSNKKELLGVYHVAKHQFDIPIVVIMCYGLNGNRSEQHRMSVKFGELCEENSLNLVRFDYSDVGVSEGDFFYSNLSSRVKNVIDIYNFIKGCYNQKLSVFLVGFSDGAKIAINAKQYISDFSGLIFWNPIIRVSTENSIKRVRMMEKLKLHKKYREPYKQLFGVCLNINMIKELDNDNSFEKLNEPFEKLFIFGEKDEFTHSIREVVEKSFFLKSKIIIIGGSGHVFSSVSWEREVSEYSIKWIKEIGGLA